jgi:hypothetical protein
MGCMMRGAPFCWSCAQSTPGSRVPPSPAPEKKLRKRRRVVSFNFVFAMMISIAAERITRSPNRLQGCF